MKCNEVRELSMNVSGCEDMWLEVAINFKMVLLVGTVYRHPGYDFNDFQLAFERNIKILTLRQRFAILGDINIDYGCYDSTTKVKSFAEIVLPV